MFYKHTKSQLYTSCNTLSHSQYHTLLTSSIHIVDELVCLQTCQPSQQTKECSSILCPTVTYITYMYLMSHTWRRLSVVSRGSCVKESSALRGNFALGGKNCQVPASPPHQARLSLSHPEVEKVRVNKQSYISLENYVPNSQLKQNYNVWGPIFYDTATEKI